jgi:hypothetical protein
MDFKKYLSEAVDKTAVMAFGRFNPPTVGHEKLIQKVRSVADEHNGTGHIFASHSELTRKDPLPQDAKIGYLNQIAHGTEIHGSSKQQPTFLHAAAKLYAQGHKHLVMIAGSDRVQEYKDKLEKYNDGKEYPHGKYKFKSIKVVSAGQRDPDAEGVEGMSGTKMRELARSNKHKQFENGLPEALKDNAKEIGNHIRAIKDEVKEDYENPYRFDDATPEGTAYMNRMTPGQKPECRDGGVWSDKLGTCVPIREAYINSEIYRLNDVVETKNGDKGPIVYRGTTYVTMQVAEGKTVKHWLTDIVEANSILPKTPKVFTKVREQRIPALFMSKEQLAEMAKSGMELTYHGYTTHNLHMCPGASDQLHELIGKQGLNPTYILKAIQASDEYLGMEKEAKAKGFANDQMVHDFNMKLAIAHDTLNMLGYPDKELTYMDNHIKTMAELSMHKDGTFSNETQNTIPTFGAGDVDEGIDSADYKIVIGKDGKKYKIRANRIITSRDTTKQVRETLTMSKFKKKIEEHNSMAPENTQAGAYTTDPATAHRDVNLRPEKEVYHGIDKTISGQGWGDKEPGFVSFKSFLATPETQKIEKDKGEAMQDVHRAKAELAVHSSAYKLMRKAHQQDQ